jgi:riboflavin synthase
MFTGLIETVGTVADLKDAGAGLRVRIRTSLAPDMTAGESVAVNGVCLTVTFVEGDDIHADIGPETARVSTLGSLQRDHAVNLERALRSDSRFGGHFVQGHVDGIGTVEDVRLERDACWLTVTFPPVLAAYFVRKGSVALDGVSLTVAGLGPDRFDVMIIPFTWAHTNLPSLKVGSKVNLECDMIGKYVARAVDLFMKAEGQGPKG